MGLISRIQFTIEFKKYSIFILMRLWRTGKVKSIEDGTKVCQDISTLSDYKFCPGIDPEYYEEEYHKVIRFHIKSVRLCECPFTRIDSVTCMHWFKPSLNLSVAQKEANEVKCPPCKRLLHHLN